MKETFNILAYSVNKVVDVLDVVVVSKEDVVDEDVELSPEWLASARSQAMSFWAARSEKDAVEAATTVVVEEDAEVVLVAIRPCMNLH